MKQLTLSLRKSGGRNSSGRICSFHIGGGHKQRYRIIDFARALKNISAIVRTIEFDPNRNGYISLMLSETGHMFYILTPEGLKLGDILIAGDKNAIMLGSCMKLRDIPLGYFVHNICYRNNYSLVRAAGCYAQILKKTNKEALLKMPSGKQVIVDINNVATIGKLSNGKHFYKIYYKAGRTRWMGKTPVVRGVAMNPVDHPMGGKTHGKLYKIPWGRLAKGVKTRIKK